MLLIHKFPGLLSCKDGLIHYEASEGNGAAITEDAGIREDGFLSPFTSKQLVLAWSF